MILSISCGSRIFGCSASTVTTIVSALGNGLVVEGAVHGATGRDVASLRSTRVGHRSEGVWLNVTAADR